LAWGLGGDGTSQFRVTHRHLPSNFLAITVSYPPWEGPGTWALSPLVGTPWQVWGETVKTFQNNHEYKTFYIVGDTAE